MVSAILNKIRYKFNQFRGIWAYKKPQFKLPEGYYSVFHNLFIRNTGDQAMKRKGYTKYNTNVVDATRKISTVFEHKTDTSRYLLAKSDNGSSGKIRYTEDTTGNYQGTWTDVPYMTTEEVGSVNILSYKNRAYICNRNNGDSPNYVTDLTNSSPMGCPPYFRTLTFGAQGTTGAMTLLATYGYLVTYLYNGDEESGSGYHAVTTTLTGSNNATTLQVPSTTDPRVTARKVYRTKANEPFIYYYLQTITDTGGVNMVDEAGDSTLLTPIPITDFFDVKQPYQSKFQVIHKSRNIQGNLTNTRYAKPPNGTFTMAVVSPGTSALSAGVYKFRFRKAYAYNDGATNKYIVGKYGEVLTTAPILAGDDIRLTLTGAMLTDNWTYNWMIERTIAGGSDFFTLGVYSRGALSTPYLVVSVSDAVLAANRANANIVIAEINNAVSDKFPTWLAISEIDKPDLFPGNASNLKKVDGDNSAITGLFGEYNQVIVFKETSIHTLNTSSQSNDYWYTTSLFTGIGAEEKSICKVRDGEYIFAFRNQTTGELNIYDWVLGSVPRICSERIKYHLAGYGDTIVGTVYDPTKNWVYILIKASSSPTDSSYIDQIRVLVYDLNLRDEAGIGNWYIYENLNANLGLYSICNTGLYGILFGQENGFVYFNNESSNVDKLGASYVDQRIKIRLETATQDAEDNVGNITKLMASVHSLGNGDANRFKVYYPTNNSLTESFAEFTLSTGYNKIITNVNIEFMFQFYMRIENDDNVEVNINWLGFDAVSKHGGAGGNVN